MIKKDCFMQEQELFIKRAINFYKNSIKETQLKIDVFSSYLKNKNMATIYEDIKKQIANEEEKISFYKDTIKIYTNALENLQKNMKLDAKNGFTII